jgi:hypothetical protein
MEITVRDFPNLGVIETTLNSTTMKMLWNLIDEAKQKEESHNSELAGNITLSLKLDNSAVFLKPILKNIVYAYQDRYGSAYHALRPGKLRNEFNLESLWVNFQYQTEFNPLHTHSGGYSFVIWMKIPTEYEDQKELPFAKNSGDKNMISNFVFTYTDILGNLNNFAYEMNKTREGILLFFPSRLNHQVFPFYNCESERISISGNLSVLSKPVSLSA